MEMETWMAAYCSAMLDAFPGRVQFIGLQGSRSRGEVTSSLCRGLTGEELRLSVMTAAGGRGGQRICY